MATPNDTANKESLALEQAAWYNNDFRMNATVLAGPSFNPVGNLAQLNFHDNVTIVHTYVLVCVTLLILQEYTVHYYLPYSPREYYLPRYLVPSVTHQASSIVFCWV